MAELQKSIEIPLQMPIEIERDGARTEIDRLIMRRPTLRQAKDLAVIGGKELARIIMGEARRGDNAEIDIEAAVEKMAETLLNKDSLDGLTQVLADMTGQSAKVIDALDWLDIVSVLKAFAGFFPARRSSAP